MNRFRIVNRYFYKLWIISQFMKVTIHNSETISELWIINFLRLTLDECRKQCSEWNLSDEEIKPHNVHNTKTKSDTAVHEQDVLQYMVIQVERPELQGFALLYSYLLPSLTFICPNLERVRMWQANRMAQWKQRTLWPLAVCLAVKAAWLPRIFFFIY